MHKLRSAGYPLHSRLSTSLLLPCVSMCHQIPILGYRRDRSGRAWQGGRKSQKKTNLTSNLRMVSIVRGSWTYLLNYRRLTQTVHHNMHGWKTKGGALWVSLKGGEWREENKENAKKGKGKQANSDTNGGERKLGPTDLHRIRGMVGYMECVGCCCTQLNWGD